MMFLPHADIVSGNTGRIQVRGESSACRYLKAFSFGRYSDFVASVKEIFPIKRIRAGMSPGVKVMDQVEASASAVSRQMGSFRPGFRNPAARFDSPRHR